MNSRPIANKLATTSLILGILGWVLYLLQWCFDLTIGLLLAAITAGSSAICASVLDFLPFVFWLAGIVTGHVALGQSKYMVAPGRWQAVWGLVLSYVGMFFTILLIVIIVSLIAAGIGVGFLDKILSALKK
ncbi:MAG: hypothetical protein ABSF99_02510 [Anaerolineales bacterium]|jgi:hypothetical protein